MNETEARKAAEAFGWFGPDEIAAAMDACKAAPGSWHEVSDCHGVVLRVDASGMWEVMNED